jgi:hypothetical protein
MNILRIDNTLFGKLYRNNKNFYKINPLNEYFESFKMNKYHGTFLWLPDHESKLFRSSITIKGNNNIFYEKIDMDFRNKILKYELSKNYEHINSIPFEILNITKEYNIKEYKLQPIIRS